VVEVMGPVKEATVAVRRRMGIHHPPTFLLPSHLFSMMKGAWEVGGIDHDVDQMDDQLLLDAPGTRKTSSERLRRWSWPTSSGRILLGLHAEFLKYSTDTQAWLLMKFC